MKKYKYIFYYISILYTVGTSLWSGTIYLFMRHSGYSYSLINLFLEIFWLVTFFAEIPSGYIADKFGYLKTIMASGIIRALGLVILALSPMNLLWMTVSGGLTALGDSLQSGTMTSWIANKAVEHGEKDQLGAIFSGYSIIGTPLTMAATFVGANILGNIRLDLPLLIGAAFLLATSLTIIPLLKYDSQNLAEAEEGMPKLNLVADVKYTVKQEQKTFAWILLLLPVAIISAGPLDQWQMYFQRGKTVNSGTISVLMSLSGMLAISLYNRYVSKKPLSNRGQTRLIVVSTVMMAATLLGVVGLKNWYYGSLSLFMLHTMFGSLENMLGGIVLQTTIQTETRRATIMSVANALDAGAEVVILAINGFLSDRFGIGFAWVSLAALGLLIFLLAIFGMQSKKLEVEEI
ncbi:MFS transporter [Lactobacillus equicursoris]|uniref:MFS transporter n=1 Tax=Lactobacillus equicursoris TaxID=420645 RepID=UPI00242D687F|nr:MFS transporter [Lactobacillus equicursoris]MDD6385698.1 MFS transporter [Lactobacillus equicursoris]